MAAMAAVVLFASQCAYAQEQPDGDPLIWDGSSHVTCDVFVEAIPAWALVDGDYEWYWIDSCDQLVGDLGICGYACSEDCDAADVVAPAGGALGSCPLEGLFEHGGRCSTTCPGGASRLPFGCDGGTVNSAAGCCAVGTSWDGAHDSSCTPCAAGTYDDDVDPSTTCAPCAAGTYSDVAGATECVLVCQPGTFSPSDCIDDPHGVIAAFEVTCVEVVDDEGCDFDMAYAGVMDGTVLGEHCPMTCGWCVGATSAASIECIGCPAGTYDDDSDPSTPCAPCTAGTYSGEVGATQCTMCPQMVGTYTPAGSNSCVGCVVGRYDSDPDPSTPCAPCAASTYSDVDGATSCATCSNGAWSPPGAAGASQCTVVHPPFGLPMSMNVIPSPLSTLLERTDSSSGVTSGDWNGDGLMDAMVVNEGSENEILISDGQGGFTSTLLERTDNSKGVTSGDWNGDGFMDA
eukprot:COSAG06_NODE_7997_length_2307_cov_2.380435_1_plen_458_part_10